MVTAFVLGVLAGVVIGACYEGCRRGGTLDLIAELARLRRNRAVASNVRVLPVHRERHR